LGIVGGDNGMKDKITKICTAKTLEEGITIPFVEGA